MADLDLEVQALAQAVTAKLAQDYGIKGVPESLLLHFVQTRYKAEDLAPVATIAFVIANAWAKGLRPVQAGFESKLGRA